MDYFYDVEEDWRDRVHQDIDFGIVNADEICGNDGIRLAGATESAERLLEEKAKGMGLAFEELIAKLPFPLWEVRVAMRANFRAGLFDQIRYGAKGRNPREAAGRCLYWARRAGINLGMNHEELAISLEQPNWQLFHRIELGELNMTDEEILANQIQICGKRPPDAPPCYEDAGTGRYHFCIHAYPNDASRVFRCLARLQTLRNEGEGLHRLLTLK